jgi:tetratricopeptide (TPR) repeat protein
MEAIRTARHPTYLDRPGRHLPGSDAAPVANGVTACHLSLNPSWDLLTVIEFGRVDDGLPPEREPRLEAEPRIRLVLGEDDDPVGFGVNEPWDVEVLALDDDAVWDGPRFDVPGLLLDEATIGEIVLATQGRYPRGSATADASLFLAAIAFGDEGREGGADLGAAVTHWRMAFEAGDMKALYGLGCTLVVAGRPREAYDALRRYVELAPANPWAWCWLGRSCAALGDTSEARGALERAIELEENGSFETDAAEVLDGLGR